ncbi:MAG TPA: peptidoglycan editing factor PgeF [Polyangiaceae bacterium]|nr:peptidoglycan editing factor PgeF [Polyangiaceae bacterium]
MQPDYLESALLRAAGFRHAFFTRKGGASSGPYSSLNFSVSVGDELELVAENFSRAGRVLGVPGDHIAVLSQVHGNVALVLDDTELARGPLWPRLAEREGDALTSRAPGLACAVRTADCVPILVGERRSGAVSAIHAGWRGIVRGVLEAALASLREIAGENPEFVAAIGPHIGPAAFETGEDVARELEASSPARDVVSTRGGRPHVALGAIVAAKLEAAGVSRTQIDDVSGCTATDPERFFSYRRDGKRSGRHLSAIVPQS